MRKQYPGCRTVVAINIFQHMTCPSWFWRAKLVVKGSYYVPVCERMGRSWAAANSQWSSWYLIDLLVETEKFSLVLLCVHKKGRVLLIVSNGRIDLRTATSFHVLFSLEFWPAFSNRWKLHLGYFNGKKILCSRKELWGFCFSLHPKMVRQSSAIQKMSMFLDHFVSQHCIWRCLASNVRKTNVFETDTKNSWDMRVAKVFSLVGLDILAERFYAMREFPEMLAVTSKSLIFVCGWMLERELWPCNQVQLGAKIQLIHWVEVNVKSGPWQKNEIWDTHVPTQNIVFFVKEMFSFHSQFGFSMIFKSLHFEEGLVRIFQQFRWVSCHPPKKSSSLSTRAEDLGWCCFGVAPNRFSRQITSFLKRFLLNKTTSFLVHPKNKLRLPSLKLRFTWKRMVGMRIVSFWGLSGLSWGAKWLLVSGGVFATCYPNLCGIKRHCIHGARWHSGYTARSSHFETFGGRSDGAMARGGLRDVGAGSGLVA